MAFIYIFIFSVLSFQCIYIIHIWFNVNVLYIFERKHKMLLANCVRVYIMRIYLLSVLYSCRKIHAGIRGSRDVGGRRTPAQRER